MLFALVAKSENDSLQDLPFFEETTETVQYSVKGDEETTSIWVYTSENHGSTIEVPLTPESTVADVLDCVTDPNRGSGCLVAVTGDTEYILNAADNAFSFVHGSWATSGSPLTFLLRYFDPEQTWPPPDLEARRQQMRRPHHKLPPPVSSLHLDYTTTQPQHYQPEGKRKSGTGKLPGGPGDLTLAELQEMATRQQQQMEAQQQVLVAKEQRLKYLKQQEARHAQLASESERLRRIRERVESQELKLKKLRALRGQAEQYRTNNGQLNSELDAVKAVFNEKEKELAMAVARVDQLTRQLKDLRNGKTNTGLSGQKHAAAAMELEKLRKELLLRNKLNEQQTNNIAAKEKVLQQKRDEVKTMDNRILELQQRLKKRKLQEDQNRQTYKQAANVQNNKENKENANVNQGHSANKMKSGDPYIQYAPNDIAKDDSYSQSGRFAKMDPKYQTLPAGVRLGQPNADTKGSKPQSHDISENKDNPEEYNLPVVLPIGNNQSKMGYNHSSSQHQRPELIQPPGKPQKFNNNDFSKPNQNFTNLPPPTSQHQPIPAQRQTPRHNVQDQSNNNNPPAPNHKVIPAPHTPRSLPSMVGQRESEHQGKGGPPSSLHPVISIHEEERQAGSGQSSPASSEGSSNSSGGIQIKSGEPNINETPIGPVSAMIERLNKGKGAPPPSKDAKPSVLPPSSSTPYFHQTSTNTTSQNGQAKSPLEGVSTFLANNKQQLYPYLRQAANQGSPDSSNLSSHSQDDRNSPRLAPDLISSGPYPGQLPSNTSISSQQGPHPQLNLKPAPTYRYASKNQIANTYMGRLGGAAMEKYQLNLNKLYKNMEAHDTKTGSGLSDATQISGAGTQGQEGDSTAFGSVSPHDYPDIASDKGSYKLNTPKQVRRRHSDGESDEVNKALQDRQEQEAKEHQQSGETTNSSQDKEKPDKSAVSGNENNQKTNVNSKLKPSEQPSATPIPSSSSTSTTPSSTPSESKPTTDAPAPSTNGKQGKVAAVTRKTKSNLKKENGVRRSNNRVSFDPLALLLDGSLEGELDLVKKVAVQVDDVSTPNDEGITALHNAICAGHYEIVKFLIEFGCDVNSPDSDGWTPLHCAASCNNLPMVRFLVEHGACVFATTISDQETAADKCEEDEDGYDGCSDYLYSIQEKLGITNSGDVYAVFDYTASNSDELNFVIGDQLTVLRKGDETEKEWWWTRLEGNEGYIPRNLLGLYPRVIQLPSEVSEC